jgi:hypothetical protein
MRGLAGGRGKIFYISHYCLRVVHCGQRSCGALGVCGLSLFHWRSVIIDTWKGGLRNPSGCALVMRNLSFLTSSLFEGAYD